MFVYLISLKDDHLPRLALHEGHTLAQLSGNISIKLLEKRYWTYKPHQAFDLDDVRNLKLFEKLFASARIEDQTKASDG